MCGAANNQLAHPGVEKQLADRGILYAPDYVVNAGGLIQVADELHGFDFERARSRASLILDTTREVFALAAAEGVPPAVAADRIAEQRMADAARATGTGGSGCPDAGGASVARAWSRSSPTTCRSRRSRRDSAGSTRSAGADSPPWSSWASDAKSVS